MVPVTPSGIVAPRHGVTRDTVHLVIGPDRCRVVPLFFPPVLNSLAHWEHRGHDTGKRRECICTLKRIVSDRFARVIRGSSGWWRNFRGIGPQNAGPDIVDVQDVSLSVGSALSDARRPSRAL